MTITGVYGTKTDTGGYVGALFARDQAMQLFTDGQHVTRSTWPAPGCPSRRCWNGSQQALPGLTYKTGEAGHQGQPRTASPTR